MKRLIVYLFVWVAVLIGCTTEADRSRMRSSLDSINVLNRNDQPFTIDDVQPYVRFFDDHGSANDRLLDHYLLGLAYYDHGEAPIKFSAIFFSLSFFLLPLHPENSRELPLKSNNNKQQKKMI